MPTKITIFFLLVVVFVGCKHNETTEPLIDSSMVITNSWLTIDTTTLEDTVALIPIKGGSFQPLFGGGDSSINLEDFFLDQYPVTKSQYLQFIKRNPQWSKSNVKRLYADQNYLASWINDTTPGNEKNSHAPVTEVSWFAATAYCKCLGKKLPTVAQWEYAAVAGKYKADERNSNEYNQFILNWYKDINTKQNPIGSTYQNYMGIWDMHGLIWEWTYDFNEVMISGESRSDVSTDVNLFCGSGSIGANDLMNYAAFMRYAFRGSLKANYNVKNLGFRCGKNKIP
ncbi:MAG: formylglycine-generating enzyme family protein [Bacteroidota bacterium]|nr:formylglycine-generating enzyme family protein [Bacteroidota bacterium]